MPESNRPRISDLHDASLDHMSNELAELTALEVENQTLAFEQEQACDLIHTLAELPIVEPSDATDAKVQAMLALAKHDAQLQRDGVKPSPKPSSKPSPKSTSRPSPSDVLGYVGFRSNWRGHLAMAAGLSMALLLGFAAGRGVLSPQNNEPLEGNDSQIAEVKTPKDANQTFVRSVEPNLEQAPDVSAVGSSPHVVDGPLQTVLSAGGSGIDSSFYPGANLIGPNQMQVDVYPRLLENWQPNAPWRWPNASGHSSGINPKAYQ